MPYPLINTYNMSEGMHILFLYVNDVTGGLWIKLTLFAFWAIVTFGLYFGLQKRIGTGDFPASVATGCFVTATLAVILKVVAGLIDPITMTILWALTLVSFLWVMFSKQ